MEEIFGGLFGWVLDLASCFVDAGALPEGSGRSEDEDRKKKR